MTFSPLLYQCTTSCTEGSIPRGLQHEAVLDEGEASGPFALHAASGKDLGQAGVVSKQGDRGGSETPN